MCFSWVLLLLVPFLLKWSRTLSPDQIYSYRVVRYTLKVEYGLRLSMHMERQGDTGVLEQYICISGAYVGNDDYFIGFP